MQLVEFLATARTPSCSISHLATPCVFYAMANTMYYALAGLSVVGLVLMVVVLAEPKSLFKVEDFDVGCGVFNCAPEGSPSDAEGAYGDRFRAMQAFGVLSVLTISATMVLHIIQAAGKEALLPLQVRAAVKFVHIVSAVFLLVFWVVVVITYTIETDGVCPIGGVSLKKVDTSGFGFSWGKSKIKVALTCKLSDVVNLNYGLFFAVFVMLLEIGLFVLAHKAQATDGNVGFKSPTQAENYHDMQRL
eukprot:TRINITY_DN993_c0_g1_i2.p1 TRINITY_DN993_c0_g1~~TRINITY_DN993_c0_g1_i2.p1  ORF type:complete len:247 (+),score=84.27 TRINITY_DN993_c0_g1_i2:445-1185(+)